MQSSFDIAIVGSGFAGSLLAMVARQIGLSVLLVERGKHPRFAIGESTAPLTNLLIEDLAHRYGLPQLLPLTQYGAWLTAYPELNRGLKRGFSFYHHSAGETFRDTELRERQLLVAASPSDRVGDTHWLRSDVDAFLVSEACERGAEYVDETAIASIQDESGGWRLQGERQGRSCDFQSRLLIDATGPRGLLSRALRIPEAPFSAYPATEALFSHFAGTRRCQEMEEYTSRDAPPYPPDSAALHHLFDGGWMWVLRFDNGIASAGVAVEDWLAREVGLREGEPAWGRILERFPSIRAQFEGAQAIRTFTHAPRLAYRAASAAGPGWAMLPSAAAFIDPLFSTGMALALLGVHRIARLMEEHGACIPPDALAAYGKTTLQEADWTADYIAACYACLGDFNRFVSLSMFYFAAASFAEMARRTGSDRLPQRFLAADHAQFAAGMAACIQKCRSGCPSGDGELARLVAASVEPLNIAGLCATWKRNWFPVDLEDLAASAAKLNLQGEDLRAMIAVVDWARD